MPVRSLVLCWVVMMMWPAVSMANDMVRTKGQRSLVTIPINVGFGPATHLMTGALQDDQTVHYGLKLSVAAVIDKAALQKNKHKIPAKYRKYVSKADEIRIGKLYVPDTVFISPKTQNTQMYGMTFRPISLGVPLMRGNARLGVSTGLLLTYAYIQSDTVMDKPMHFFRPGLDAKVEFELPFSKSFLMSLGWASQFYIPQALNGGFLEFKSIKESLWHIGQAFLLFHVRFPYQTRL